MAICSTLIDVSWQSNFAKSQNVLLEAKAVDL
jgi:hypothetical protein